MATERRTRVTDVAAFRALANPVRYRILGHLLAMGPQTASDCAAYVGATPSNCSYHLRELGRFGLVERVPGGSGDGRDRPWRTTATGYSYQLDAADRDDPAARLASDRLAHLGIDDDAHLAHLALERHKNQPPDWRDAESNATYGLRVSAEELRTITQRVDAVLRPYIGLTRDDAPADAHPVHVTFRAFVRPPEAP
jgi:DNA-binding transcriptional ArsR family regulator